MNKNKKNGQNNGVETSTRKNNKGMYTYGNESDCTFFKTKKEAKEHRKENFGSLYASEAEMDRLLPIYKTKDASAQMIEDITNEISEAMDQVIGTGDEVSILNDMFKVSWEEEEHPYVIFPKGSNNFYVFSIRSNGWSDWSEEISIEVDQWNELAEEAQEGIASGLAEATFMAFGDRIMNAKKLVGTFEDDDFGEVSIFWYENSNYIKADDLIINNVPKEQFYGEVINGTFSEKFGKAWNFYTSVYHTYGTVTLSYDQLEDEQLSEIRNQFVED